MMGYFHISYPYEDLQVRARLTLCHGTFIQRLRGLGHCGGFKSSSAIASYILSVQDLW